MIVLAVLLTFLGIALNIVLAYDTPADLDDLRIDCWDRDHAGQSVWECQHCGRDVCPRCEPSPEETTLCPDCDEWTDT